MFFSIAIISLLQVIWSRRQESNLYLTLRRHTFYPLNYGEILRFYNECLKILIFRLDKKINTSLDQWLIENGSCLIRINGDNSF